MKLLRDKNALMLTYMQNEEQDIYCYRVYIMDGMFAMNLYSVSHFRMADQSLRIEKNTEPSKSISCLEMYLMV